jgi:protein tyrosine/serine phosphatase
VRNFAVVNAHLLRGGEPSTVGLTELAAAGVKIDIDLRQTSAATDFEKRAVEKLKIKYINVPLPALSAPSPSDVRKVLNLLNEETSGVVFVHCRRGKDRTGTIIACYRIQHDGWDHERALREAKSHGMSFAERGMRSFILHFSPALNAGNPALPAP